MSARAERRASSRRASASPADAVVVHANGRVALWSAAARAMFGHATGDIVGRRLTTLFAPEHREALGRLDAAPFRAVALRADGTRFVAEVALERWESEGQQFVACTVRDLSRGNSWLAKYHDVFLAATAIVAESSTLASAAPRLIASTADALGAIAGAIWLADGRSRLRRSYFWQSPDSDDAVDHDAGEDLVRRVFADRAAGWLQEEDGAPLPMMAFPIGDDGVFQLFCSDAVAGEPSLIELMSHVGRQIALLLARERETARLRLLVEKNPAGVFLATPDERITVANDALGRMLGFASGESVVGMRCEDFCFDVAELSAVRAELDRSGTVVSREVMLRRRDGTTLCALLNLTRTSEELIGTLIDYQEHKQTDDRLREVTRNFAEAQQFAHVGSFERDLRTNASYWSDELYRIFGMEPQLRPGDLSTVLNAVVPEEREKVGAAIEHAISSGDGFDLRFRIHRVGGEERVLRARAWLRMEHGQPVAFRGTVLDVTDDEAAALERMALQRELDETKRLSSLGRLAATMAHEFNNVLMGIDTFVELIRRRGDEHTQTAATRIQQSLKRGRTITNEILRYTRAAAPLKGAIDVRRWLSEFEHEAHALTAGAASVEVAEPLRISGDVAQLNQVLVNLVLNARDASPPGAPITISARTAAGDICGFPAPEGCLDLVVADRGTGIPEDMRERIFEPLFTTKRGGTGIGLAVVHQVIRAHGGTIRVASQAGEGTELHLLLPLAEAEVESESQLPRQVLLAEGDPGIAVALEALLEAEGVNVRVLSHGRDVVAEVDKTVPDALIIDVTLPDASGIDVYREVARRWPRLPVLFMTNVDRPPALEAVLAQPYAALLRKPFDTEELLEALRRISRDKVSGSRTLS